MIILLLLIIITIIILKRISYETLCLYEMLKSPFYNVNVRLSRFPRIESFSIKWVVAADRKIDKKKEICELTKQRLIDS